MLLGFGDQACNKFVVNQLHASHHSRARSIVDEFWRFWDQVAAFGRTARNVTARPFVMIVAGLSRFWECCVWVPRSKGEVQLVPPEVWFDEYMRLQDVALLAIRCRQQR